MPHTTTTSTTTPTTSSPTVPGRERRAVRRRPQLTHFTATSVTEPTEAQVQGLTILAQPGMWIISRGTQVVEVLSAAQFEKHYEPATDPGITVTGDVRKALETALGFGTTESPERLLGAVRRLADLKIGPITIEFTPAQHEVLIHRAEKRGLSYEDYLKQLVDRLMTELFLI